MKLKLLSFLLLILLLTPLTVRSQSSFTVAGIKPYDKAVPGQVMDVLIEGLSSGFEPVVLPETDFNVEVLQDGVRQKAKVRLTKYTMVSDRTPQSSSENNVEIAGIKMTAYQAVSFVVPQGLHPGRAEVSVKYKGKRGNSIALEIVEKPLKPVVGTTAVLAVGGMQPDRTGPIKLEGNDLGWRLERGVTTRVFVNPLVDPDDPNSAVLFRFKQSGNDYDAVTRITSTPARVIERGGAGVGFMAAREELEVDVPAELTLGRAEVEIRIKANGQPSDPVILAATITDVTRSADAPNLSAPRVLAVTPKRVGAGQSLLISVDQRRTLEPSPKETRVIVEQDHTRYMATIEQNSALIGPGKQPDAPVAFIIRTSRQLIGRVQIRVLNPLRGEQIGMSEPVSLEIVDEVLPPELISVNEATDADLAQVKKMYEIQQQAGKEFTPYDPDSRYLAIRVRGIDHNPKFIRITLEQTDVKLTLSHRGFSFFTGETLIVKLPDELTAGPVKLTIENSGGDDRYSTPVTKSFVLQKRE